MTLPVKPEKGLLPTSEGGSNGEIVSLSVRLRASPPAACPALAVTRPMRVVDARTGRGAVAGGVAGVQGAELWRPEPRLLVLPERRCPGAVALARLAVEQMERLAHGVPPSKTQCSDLLRALPPGCGWSFGDDDDDRVVYTMEDSTECFVHMLDALRSADARHCSCLAYTARETRTCGYCGHVVNAVRGTDVTAPVWQLGLPVDGSQTSVQKLVNVYNASVPCGAEAIVNAVRLYLDQVDDDDSAADPAEMAEPLLRCLIKTDMVRCRLHLFTVLVQAESYALWRIACGGGVTLLCTLHMPQCSPGAVCSNRAHTRRKSGPSPGLHCCHIAPRRKGSCPCCPNKCPPRCAASSPFLSRRAQA